MLYELLTYQKAFAAESAYTVFQKILHDQPAPLSAIVPALDPALDGIVDRALAKHPSARYQSVTLLAEDLERVISRIGQEQADHTGVFSVPSPLDAAQTVHARPDMASLAERRATRISAHLEAAQARLDGHDLDGAIAEVERACEIDPDDPRAVHLYERVSQALGERQAEGGPVAAGAHHRRPEDPRQPEVVGAAEEHTMCGEVDATCPAPATSPANQTSKPDSDAAARSGAFALLAAAFRWLREWRHPAPIEDEESGPCRRVPHAGSAAACAAGCVGSA